MAVKEVFGKDHPDIINSSTIGATGHMMRKGGITEVITCIQANQEVIVPPTMNLTDKEPECNLDYIPQKARKTTVNTAMSISFGLGRQNTMLIVRRFIP